MNRDSKMERTMIRLITPPKEWFEFDASKLAIVLVCAAADFCALFSIIDYAVQAQAPFITGLITFGYSLLLCIPPVILAKQLHGYEKMTVGESEESKKNKRRSLYLMIILIAGELLGLYMQFYLRTNAETVSSYNAMATTTAQDTGLDPGEVFMSWIPCFTAIVNFFITYVTTGEAEEEAKKRIKRVKLRLLAIKNKTRISEMGLTSDYLDNLRGRENSVCEAEMQRIASEAYAREARSKLELAKMQRLGGDDIDDLVKEFNEGVHHGKM